VNIDDIDHYIHPSQKPFGGDSPDDSRLRVFLRLSGRSGKTGGRCGRPSSPRAARAVGKGVIWLFSLASAGSSMHCETVAPAMSEVGQKPRPSQPHHVSFRRQRTLVRQASVGQAVQLCLGCAGWGRPRHERVDLVPAQGRALLQRGGGFRSISEHAPATGSDDSHCF
jgi:hypothetical protein